MNAMKRVLAVLAAASLLVFISGCQQQSREITNLSTVEVRNYEGKDLSSILDFRENSIKGPQHVNVSGYSLRVYGLVGTPRNYSYDDVLSHKKYSKVVELNCVEGWSVKILWEGVLVKDLLEEANVKDNADTVIFRAYDGYSTSFPMDYIRNRSIILAYRMNNVTLPAERGFPFELVAEDKWGYKWIKWVTEIEASNNSAYRGYWEQAGYSQNGDLNKPMFG
jgi:DMSO/TMAO reductase YedYZ molybdopterin-dependent catalytic subunit